MLRPMAGATTSLIQRSRSITAGPLAPQRKGSGTLPSLRIVTAVLPNVGLVIEYAIIDGEITPAMGETLPAWSFRQHLYFAAG